MNAIHWGLRLPGGRRWLSGKWLGWALAACLPLTLAAPAAQASCGLSLNASNVSISWNLNFATLAVAITLTKANAPACNFGIGISKGGAASEAARRVASGSNQLPYNIYQDSALTEMLEDYPDIQSSQNVILGGFVAGTNLTQTIVYYLTIPYATATSPTLVPPGTYSDSYNIDAYEGTDYTTFVTPAATSTVNLTVTVPYLICMSLVNSGSAFDQSQTSRNINFGALYPGESTGFDLRVRTNAGFNITFSSQNNGYLKPSGSSTATGVPYLFYVNSALLNLASSSGSPVTGLSGNGQTGLQGLGYPINVVIGNFSGASVVAGTLQDQILVTATTTD